MNNNSKDALSFVLAVISIQMMGGFASALPPLILGGLMAGLSLSESQAGSILFIELAALAFAALASASILTRFRYKTLCFIAVSIVITANIFTVFFADTFLSVSICRLFAGLAAGILYAVAVAAVASLSTNPDRLYGLIQVAWAASNLLMYSLGGYLSEFYAYRGVFALIGVATIVLVPMIRYLPEVESRKSGSKTKKLEFLATGVIAYAAVFIYLVGSAALFVFSEPLGIRAGLTRSQIGLAFSAASVIGLGGAAFATWLNIRKGRTLPITLMLLLFIFDAVIICGTQNSVVYIGALVFQTVLYFFSVPYCFGVGAALDRQGRWAAAIASAFLIGFAVGPGLGGYVIEWSGYDGLALLVVISCVLSWLLFMVVIRQINLRVGSISTAPEA